MYLSIIVPTYNRLSVLERAITSIVSQDFLEGRDDWELILVDDGSIDNTQDWVRSNYPNVVYIKQSNLGVSAARNAGLERAMGEWVALLDSDDEWLPTKLSRQFDLLTKTNLKICHTEEIWIRNGVRVNQMNKHKKAGGWIFERCLPLCAMSPSSIVIHRSVFEDTGVFDTSLPACEDYDLWLRITSQYEVAYVEEPCIKKYGGHSDQLSRLHWGMDRFRVIALEKLLSRGDSLKPLDKELARAMLMKKLGILLKGAIKHNNVELIDRCENSLTRFS